jgi:glycosyltransferase involved in cell wall biosynthesis
MAAPRLSVTAPCFNEGEVITLVVQEWTTVLDGFPFDSEIVICNDGSTDDSAARLAELQRIHPRLRVVELATNSGYGKALTSAIDVASGEFIATIDSDGQFDLADVLPLLAALEDGGLDLVTGFRSRKQDTPFRVFANHVLNAIVRLVFRVHLRDTNCAIKVARAATLRGLRLEGRGWSTPTEICLRVHARGGRISEVGVSHRERKLGASKLHPFRTGWALLRFLVYLRMKISLYRARILIEP